VSLRALARQSVLSLVLRLDEIATLRSQSRLVTPASLRAVARQSVLSLVLRLDEIATLRLQ
jgi:hypothetical protein